MKRAAAAGTALGLGIALVFAIEGVLALAGVRPLEREDLFVGFERSSPLFVPAGQKGGATVYGLNPAKEKHFNAQSFLMPKPPGVFRIVSFGGSTTYGRPYIDATSFPAWTARLLSRAAPSRTWENINAGGISYASYRVRLLAEELSRFSPDLYVLYSGHNEFLERRTFDALIAERPTVRRLRALLHRSRIYTLLYRAAGRVSPRLARGRRQTLGGEVEALLDSVGPQAYHRDLFLRDGVVEQYRRNLELIVRLSRERGIPLVICTLASNLSGFSPFKSEHRDGLTPAELDAWEADVERGERALAHGRPAEALEAFAAAARVDDRYAHLSFLQGRALEGLSRWDEASAAYVRAKEEDIVPLRAPEAINAIVRETARREGVPLADVEALFRRLSPHGIPGSNLFVDHLHPTLEGSQLIAGAVADAAVRAGVVPVDPAVWERGRGEAQAWLAGELAQVSGRYRALGYWGVGREVLWGGKHEEAYAAFREAWKTVRDVRDLGYKLGLLEGERGDADAAVAVLEETAARFTGDAEVRLALAEVHLMRGDAARAAPIVESLVAPQDADAHRRLVRAEVRRQQGRSREALDDIAAAERLAPDDASVRMEIVDAWLRLGERAAAEEHYRQYLRLAAERDPGRALEKWRRALGTAAVPATGAAR